MGPCFMSTEDDLTANGVVTSTNGFNGAVLHEHGRRRCGGIFDDDPDASMGPCFMSTEDTLRGEELRRFEAELQWGRAS